MKRRSFITSYAAMALGGLFSVPTKAQETRNNKTKTIDTDILVCGGGPSGVAAATMDGSWNLSSKITGLLV